MDRVYAIVDWIVYSCFSFRVNHLEIHSFGAARFAELFDRVEQHPDGEWWEV